MMRNVNAVIAIYNHSGLRSISLAHSLSFRLYSSSSSSVMNVGVVGLGQMGAHMARNLFKSSSSSGIRVCVFDTNSSTLSKLSSEGMKVANSLEEIAKESDFLMTMLPSNESVRSVVSQAIPFMKRGALVIDSSTIDPLVAREVNELCKGKGVGFVDAPVSGGVGGAAAATLTFMLGTPSGSDLYKKALPILSLMGKNVVGCGENIGSGQVAKICNNLLLGISMIGVSEAMNLGVKLGMEPKVLAAIINSSSGRCWSSEIYNPVRGVTKGAPAEKDYEGGFGVLLMKKDLGLAVDAANKVNAPLALGKKALNMYEELGSNGTYKSKDFSSVYKYLSEK